MINIPRKINVGFQERKDTYTGKLGYVIYYDDKGKLCKEKSWNNWRNKSIPNQEFDNEPISGFVLNKKVGDYRSDWNHRQAYSRVYDPRGFEFEITIENLLYILENTSSIKGKGLEGDFVYAWNGKDLFLMPTSAPDYEEIVRLNTIVYDKQQITAKELIVGGEYRFKSDDILIYMGRFELWEHSWKQKKYISKGLNYFFCKRGKLFPVNWKTFKSINSNIVECVSDTCVHDYAELFERLQCRTDFSPPDASKDETIQYTREEFTKLVQEMNWRFVFNDYLGNVIDLRYQNFDNIYRDDNYNIWHDNKDSSRLKRYFSSIDDVFNTLRPTYTKQYLTNGKLYHTGVKNEY